MKRWKFSSGNVTPVNTGGAFDKRVQNVGRLAIECFGVEDLDVQCGGGAKRERRHTIPTANVRETVNPCIHVTAIKRREAEHRGALIVEAIPVIDRSAVKSNLRHFQTGVDACRRPTSR